METFIIIEKILTESGIEFTQDYELLDMDSITFISMIIGIEQEFNIQFPDEYLSFEKLKNLDTIVEIVEAIKNNTV